MGRKSRRKGLAFQSRVARWLTDVTGREHRSTQGLETTRGNMGDVAEVDGHGLPKMDQRLYQCKKGKRPNPWQALREAKEIGGHRGIAIIHKDAPKPGQSSEQMVCMTPEQFAHLIGRPNRTPAL